MSDDQNYEDEVKGGQQNLQQQSHRTVESVQLNKMIYTILNESKKTQPLFPPFLSKKISESFGLESSEDVMYNVLSNMVEFSLNELLTQNKEIKSSGKYKKDGKDNQLKTIELQRLMQSKGINIANPRCYPQIANEKKKANKSMEAESGQNITEKMQAQ